MTFEEVNRKRRAYGKPQISRAQYDAEERKRRNKYSDGYDHNTFINDMITTSFINSSTGFSDSPMSSDYSSPSSDSFSGGGGDFGGGGSSGDFGGGGSGD